MKGNYMRRSKTEISHADSYEKIGAYWDSHDLTEINESGIEAKFDVDVQAEIAYYALEKNLAETIENIAVKHGISGDTLVNMWLQERILIEKQK
jgi:hypothetical protein